MVLRLPFGDRTLFVQPRDFGFVRRGSLGSFGAPSLGSFGAINASFVWTRAIGFKQLEIDHSGYIQMIREIAASGHFLADVRRQKVSLDLTGAFKNLTTIVSPF